MGPSSASVCERSEVERAGLEPLPCLLCQFHLVPRLPTHQGTELVQLRVPSVGRRLREAVQRDHAGRKEVLVVPPRLVPGRDDGDEGVVGRSGYLLRQRLSNDGGRGEEDG